MSHHQFEKNKVPSIADFVVGFIDYENDSKLLSYSIDYLNHVINSSVINYVVNYMGSVLEKGGNLIKAVGVADVNVG